MKIHFRFFLSHDNSEKYQYFMKQELSEDNDARQAATITK